MSKPNKTTYTIDECYLMMFSEYENIVTAQEAASMLRLPAKRPTGQEIKGQTEE